MTSPHDTYTSPLASRNASPEMLRIWSPRHKFTTWRRIWLAVAEAQQACGLEISDEQIAQMRAHVEVTDEDMERAAGYEKDLRHDVMAHVHAYGDVAPAAKSIIHLGCTSQDVVCNADLVTQEMALRLIERKIGAITIAMGQFADTWKDSATLGFTHYQAAQPTTVGRRACGWLQDIECSFRAFWDRDRECARLRGCKGARGTEGVLQ